MHHGEMHSVKYSEGLCIFDQHYGYPQRDDQEIYEGPTGKVIDIQGIQAHAGCDFFVPEGKEFSFDIDECPYLQIAIKAEPGTNTCLFLLVHERKHDWNRRFVVIGKTPQGDCQRRLMSNYFTIEDDNKWHEYVYDLRKIREEEDNNIYHQLLCPDAGSIREIQFYSCTGSGTHTFHFKPSPSKAPVEVRIKDFPPRLQSLFTPRRTNRWVMSSRLHHLPSKERFERLVKKFENIHRLGAAQKIAAHEIIKVQKDYRRAEKKTRGIEIKPLTEFSEEEKLRILIFDGPVGLTQTLTHEGLSYPLDNPSPSGYVGYIIVADRIILKEDINTKSHDLILVAKEISVSNDVPRVFLNTQPPEMGQAAQEGKEDADNGGDIIFLAKEFLNSSKVHVVTTGGTGQDGGHGRPISNPTTVTIWKEETSITYALLFGNLSKFDFGDDCKLWGTVVDFQPHDSFYRDPPSCWFVRYDPDSKEYYVLPPLPRGQYGLVNRAHDAATFTTVWINIYAKYYPTDGKSGGYGGLPGKVSLIMPKAPTMPGIAVTAETGRDGAPGKGGAGGEMMPVSVYLPTGDPAPLKIHEYINRHSKENPKVTDRFDTPGTTSEYFPSGTDRFRNIDSMPSSEIVKALSKLEVTGGIKIRYYASLDAKQSGDESRLEERWSAGPYMKRAAFRYRCKLAYLNDMWFANLSNYDSFQNILYTKNRCSFPTSVTTKQPPVNHKL